MSKSETAIEVQNKPSDFLVVLDKIATTPNMNVDVIERILAVQERLIADQRKTAFMAAMARLQEKLPQINKDGLIIVKGQERSRYSRLEDIDIAIRPLLTGEGFSFSFDEESSDDKHKRFSCKLSHRDGHSETKHLTVPVDVSEYRTNIQSVGSTTSYARRYLIKMHLNLMERGEDTDGNNLQSITTEQAKDILALIDEVGANLDKFLVYMGVDSVNNILARDLTKAVVALETRRRRNQQGK